MKVTLCRALQFDSAHRNTAPGAPARSAQMHGHTYEVEIQLTGTIDESMGWLIDFGEIKAAAVEIVDSLDHRCLNEIAGLQDTSLRDLSHWIKERLQARLPEGLECPVRILGATDFDPILKPGNSGEAGFLYSFGFAAAHFLPRVPEGHKCRRLHGHSFGVTIDTTRPGQVLARLGEVYPMLEHSVLNDLPGLENPTSEMLAGWLWKKLGSEIAHIRELAISETCTTRCLYRGES